METITLTIDKLAGLGDGAGVFEGRKAYVRYTLPGDVVRARITRETAEAVYGVPVEILTPSPERAAALCGHFATCGGCSLQHMRPEAYAAFKQKMAEEAVRKAGFDTEAVQKLVIIPAASRRRAEFKIDGGKLGFYEEQSHSLVDMEECPVLEPELFALAMQMKARLTPLPRAKLHINKVEGGFDALLECSAKSLPDFSDCASLLRLCQRDGKEVRTVFERTPVTLKLGDVNVPLPPGAFLQATQAAQDIMTSLVKEAVRDAKSVIDLFCGIGTFSFPLLPRERISAVEGDGAMVAAVNQAAKAQNLGKSFRAEKRDLFANPLPSSAFASTDAAIINPPRVGAKAQAEALAASRVPCIVMVSCNPATFSRDARILREGGYRLTKLTPIDQFIYSAHLELVAEFRK